MWWIEQTMELSQYRTVRVNTKCQYLKPSFRFYMLALFRESCILVIQLWNMMFNWLNTGTLYYCISFAMYHILYSHYSIKVNTYIFWQTLLVFLITLNRTILISFQLNLTHTIQILTPTLHTTLHIFMSYIQCCIYYWFIPINNWVPFIYSHWNLQI